MFQQTAHTLNNQSLNPNSGKEKRTTNNTKTQIHKIDQRFNPYDKDGIGKGAFKWILYNVVYKILLLDNSLTDFKKHLIRRMLEQLTFGATIHGYAYYKQVTLATILKSGRTSIKEALQYLETHGFIERIRPTMSETRGRQSTRYHILWHKSYPKAMEKYSRDHVKVGFKPASKGVSNFSKYTNKNRKHTEVSSIPGNTSLQRTSGKLKPKRTRNCVSDPVNGHVTNSIYNYNKQKKSTTNYEAKEQETSSSSSFKIDSLKNHLESKIIDNWEKQGLTDWHVDNWTKEITHSIEETGKCLMYAYHDFVINEKQVNKSYLNYLYGTMKRIGTYPKPKNFKTKAEIQAERIKRLKVEAAEKSREQVKEQEKLKKQEQQEAKSIAFEKKYGVEFRTMLRSPNSAIYKACFARLRNDFLKQREAKYRRSKAAKSGEKEPFLIELEMKKAFLEVKSR